MYVAVMLQPALLIKLDPSHASEECALVWKEGYRHAQAAVTYCLRKSRAMAATAERKQATAPPVNWSRAHGAFLLQAHWCC